MRLQSPKAPAAAAVVIVTLVMGLSMFAEPMGIAGSDEFRNNDWLNCRSFDVLTRRALLEDGEFPLRTHLLGGGFPVIAHPSDGSWAPTIIPVLIFGDVIGVKVNILLFLLAGAWGVWLIAFHRLGLGAAGSTFSALLFVVSGWLPSMLLVGFYNQLFFLMTPLILYLLVQSVGKPERLIGAGFLLCVVLQQGGHAFPAVCFFCAVCCWMVAAGEGEDSTVGPLLRWSAAVGLLLLWTAPLAFARGLDSAWPIPLGWAVAVGVMVTTQSGRSFSKRLWPWALRLGLVLCVASSLGVARFVGLAMLSEEGEYSHRLERGDSLWFPDPHRPPHPEERFYDSLPDFLRSAADRVPAEMDYGFDRGRPGDPTGHEYAYLGLTPPVLALAIIGFPLLLRQRRTAWLAVGAALILGVCFGWRAPPDLHFLLTWGFPGLEAFSQPIKYWNFFVLLGLILSAGGAVRWSIERVHSSTAKRCVTVALFGLLLWPLAQNREVLEETFSKPRPAPEQEDYRQSLLIAEPEWAVMSLPDIRRVSDSLFLRDYVRPESSTEYFNIHRGVGTIDWYGSLVMADEHAAPASFVTLEGDAVSNPSFRGEVWVDGPEGVGQIESYRIGHNRLSAEVVLLSPGTIVFNQNWLEGFVINSGELVDHGGLIGVQLPAGEHSVSLDYRPLDLRLGLLASLVSGIFWLLALLFLLKRRCGSRLQPSA